MIMANQVPILNDQVDLDRRKFVHGLGAFSSALAIGAYSKPIFAASRPPLRIDAHCHVFNGRDLPIYGLLFSIIVEQNVFGIFAEPLPRWLAASIEGKARTYDDERDVLDHHLIPNPGAISEYKRDSDRPVDILDEGLKKFIDRYTSFGQNRTPFANDLNDTFLFELLIRYGRPLFMQGETTKTDIMPRLQDKEFRQEIIKRLLQDPETKRRLGITDEFGEYLAQFSRWATKFVDYRFHLADDLGGRFGEPDPDELRIMTPAIVDFGHWPLRWWYVEDVTKIDQQAELLQKIALIQPNRRKIHGFIGFAPWRYLNDLHIGIRPNALEVVNTAIKERGFVGVKLYPPMGFQPYDNRFLSKNDFPDELRSLYDNPGPKLDWALRKLYAYCNKERIAIMAHCADTIGAHQGYAKRAAPRLWTYVIENYPGVRLNLGHFGGIWDYFSDDACRVSTNTPWPSHIAEMIGNHLNLYVDVGDFSGVLQRWDSEKCSTRKIFSNLRKLLRGNNKLASRIMYGSDWIMLEREPRNKDYYKAMRDRFAGILSNDELDGFVGQNAAAFLGLQRGHLTRKRIDEFYVNNRQMPPDFDRYLIS